MHTCPPPLDALADWLEEYPSEEGSYGHLLLEQSGEADQTLVDALRPYLESAHLDARTHFHREIGIDLHPDADDQGAHAMYPQCLPATARRGVFGELMAGLITEAYALIGGHSWRIPVFLFRYHADVAAYMFALARDPERVRQVFGRFGSDFIAISLDEDGAVTRVISGEAKWRRTLTPGGVNVLLKGERVRNEATGEMEHDGKGIWHQLNTDVPVPQGVRQLQRLLEEHDPDGFSAAILSMDRALTLRDPVPIPRTDLILIVGNSPARRKPATAAIAWQEAPPEYETGRDLQVVEVYLRDGEALIDALYDSLWAEEEAHAAP